MRFEYVRDSQQDSGTRSQCPHQVTGHTQSTNAGTSESSGRRNYTLKLLVHALFSVACHNQALLFQLLSHIPWRRSADLNPSFRENSAGDQHEHNIDGGMNRIKEGLSEIQRGRHVVGDTGGRIELSAAFTRFPDTEELDEEVVAEARVHHLADQKDIGAKRGLEHDGHIGGIEEAHWVATAHASLAGGLDGDFDAETLKVDDLLRISLKDSDKDTLWENIL